MLPSSPWRAFPAFASPSSSGLGRFVRQALACLTALALVAIASAAESVKMNFDVAAGEAGPALKQFAQQARREIMFLAKPVEGVKTNAVRGELTVREGLDQLLAGTALRVQEDAKTGGLVVQRVDDPNGPRAALEKRSDRPSEKADANAGETLTMGVYEVTSHKPFTDANVDLVRTMNDVQPYYTFPSGVLEKSGANSVEEFLRQRLPMNAAAGTNSQSATSVAGLIPVINLRGLGSSATTILLNGRRLMGTITNGGISQANINAIPFGSIDRIEVLPESASALYGGSAMGGVVNVVLKRNYTGAEIKTTYENTFERDTPIRTLDASAGFSLEGGRTRFLLSGHYSDAGALQVRDLGFFSDYLATIIRNNPARLYSAANPFLGATPNIGATTNLVLKPAFGGTALNATTTFVPAGFTATSSPTAFVANAGHFNAAFAPTTQSAYGLEFPVGIVPRNKSLYANLRREMGHGLEWFAEFANSSSISANILNPFVGAISIPATSPTNPFQQAVSVRAPLAFNAPNTLDLVERRLTTGFTLALPADWKAAGDVTWTRAAYLTYNFGLADTVAMNAAIANGSLNLFTDTIATAPNLAAFVGREIQVNRASSNAVQFKASGPLGRLPAGQPQVTVGVEHRREGNNDSPDIATFPNPVSNFTRVFLGHGQTIAAVFAELDVPLVAERNHLPAVNSVDLQFAGRRESYTLNTGSTFVLVPSSTPIVNSTSKITANSPMAGIRYSPLKGLMFRGSYSTAFLPPSFGQLVPPSPGSAGTPIIDPRRGNTTYNVPTQTGGDPSLRPVTSRNWEAGVIFEPAFAKGLRVALDWYQIKQRDRIQTLTTQLLVNNEAVFPSRVTRGAAPAGDAYGVGPITLVNNAFLNIAKAESEGLDLTFEYEKSLGDLGHFDVFAVGTYTRHFKTQSTLNAPLLEIVNQVANTGPLQRRGNVTLAWDRGSWSASWTLTYFGSYPQASANAVVTLAQGASSIPSQTYHNLVIGYRITAGADAGTVRRMMKGISLQLGVKNLFDHAPPFDANSSPYYYSPLATGAERGRGWWLSVRKQF
jgi:iron complex outermembrane receptor protein